MPRPANLVHRALVHNLLLRAGFTNRSELKMKGEISTRHLLTCAREIITGFGWRTYFRAVLTALHLSHRHTFLECIS